MTQERTTKYTLAVKNNMYRMGHATNLQILERLRMQYPELSITTVHRITKRMAERGELAIAPSSQDHAVRFDINLSDHDHFQCSRCDGLRDLTLPSEIVNALKDIVRDCELNGRLTIQGSCKECIKKFKEGNKV